MIRIMQVRAALMLTSLAFNTLAIDDPRRDKALKIDETFTSQTEHAEAELGSAELSATDDELAPPSGNTSFGQFVAVSADWAVVGGHRHVYMLARNVATRRWHISEELLDAGHPIKDVYSVAIADDIVVLGAARQNQVHVFRRSSDLNTWSKDITLAGVAGSVLGYSVALTRTPTDFVLAAGADGTRSVEIYRRSPESGIWRHEASILNPENATDYTGFGNSVALDGNRLAVGSYFETHSGLAGAGAVYVFARSGSNWELQQRLTAGEHSRKNGYFGHVIAIAGDQLAAGHTFYADRQGAVHPHTFDPATATWKAGNLLQVTNGGSGDQLFGSSLALTDSRLVVGAVNHDHGAEDSNEGAAFIYTTGDAGWNLSHAHKGSAGSRLGASVAARDDMVLAGAPGIASSEGRLHIFGGSSIAPNRRSLTGGWYNPATAGQGFMLEVYPDIDDAGRSRLFVGWYTYDTAAGAGGYDKQRWYVIQGDTEPDDDVVTLGIHTNYGGNFDAPPVTSSTQVGTATLSFESCTRGTLTYTFTAGSNTGRNGIIPVARLLDDAGCSGSTDTSSVDDADAGLFKLSGNWYEPATSGQGLMIEINPSSRHLFAGWFTYAPDGQSIGGPVSQRWYTLQAPIPATGRSFVDVPIYGTTGGVFDAPGTVATEQLGRATLSFQSCSAATLSYTFTAGPNAGRNGTIDLSRTGSTPANCAF